MEQAFAYLTCLGSSPAPDRKAVAWFPLVGVVIGSIVGAAWWLTADHLFPLVACALVLVVDAILTALLHYEGTLRGAEYLVPVVERAERFEIMKDRRVGPRGISTFSLVLLLRWSTLAVLTPSVPVIAAIWCTSRTVMAVAASVFPYARPNGAGAAIKDRSVGIAAVSGIIAVVALVAWSGDYKLLAGVAGCAIGGFAVVLLARRRLGGFTGDVLAASALIGETVGLLVLAW